MSLMCLLIFKTRKRATKSLLKLSNTYESLQWWFHCVSKIRTFILWESTEKKVVKRGKILQSHCFRK